MEIFTHPITLEDKPFLDTYLNSFDYRASGLTFTSLFMWRNIDQFRWEPIGDFLFLTALIYSDASRENVRPYLLPPLTRTGEYDRAALREAVLEARRRFEEKGCPFRIRLIPFHMAQILQEACPELIIRDDRANYDYIYRTKDLIELKGRDYHSKKNHLNYFRRTFDYEYVPLTADMADEAMEFIAAFNARKDVSDLEMLTLRMEEEALRGVFENLEDVGYRAGAIRIDGKIQALAVGGRLNRNTIVEHVEKANVEFRGLYQAINNEFCKAAAADFKYINREEDMGLPNLRKAKLSYHPCKLLEKYIGVFR